MKMMKTRRPADDAPLYDPTQWEGGADCTFLTVRADMERQKELIQRQLGFAASFAEAQGEGKGSTSSNDVATNGARNGGGLWRWLVSWMYGTTEDSAVERKNALRNAARQMPFDELYMRLQQSLDVGDVETASRMAAELARRKQPMPPQAADAQKATASKNSNKPVSRPSVGFSF